MQRISIGLSMTALWLFAAAAGAQQGDADDERAANLPEGGEECLSLQRIRRSEVIDDQTIVFHLRGGDIYVNNLPRRCPGLERNERFMYELHTSRLCSIDMITVIEGFGASRSRGFNCRIGEFYPISEEVLGLLRDGGDIPGAGNSVEMKPIELPDPDESDAPPPEE